MVLQNCPARARGPVAQNGDPSRRSRLSREERYLYWLLGLMLAACAGAGMAVQGAASTLRGVWDLQGHPARLLNDFTLAGGEGAAVVNAVLVAAIGLALVRINRIKLSGPTVAAVFTMLGFGLFGKTPLNVAPIILGVYVAARIAGKKFGEYILIALFGTALGPLVSLVAVELGLPGWFAIVAASAAGVAAGVLLPAVSVVMLRMHQGYNLYNIGLTSGFLALFAAGLAFARSSQLPGGGLWNESPSVFLVLLVPALSIVMIASGLALGGRKALGDFARILRLPGRLPSDFMDMTSPAGSLFNMGVMALACWAYVLAVRGDFNGPVLGGIFTVIGFAAFGKHPRNSWPVVAGIIIGALAFGRTLDAPAVILAALFGTTLAPVAGQFGIGAGLAAGVLHLVTVERSGAWHAGIDLYNNGFAGGLTATLVVGVIEWYKSVAGPRDIGDGSLAQGGGKRQYESERVHPPSDR